MDKGSVYNVMASSDTLDEMFVQFPALEIEERFSKTDINVILPDDPEYEDDFVEWCEENVLEFKLV